MAMKSVLRRLHTHPRDWRPCRAVASHARARDALDAMIRDGWVEVRSEEILGRTVATCRLAAGAIDHGLAADVRGQQLGRLLARQTDELREHAICKERLRTELTGLVRAVARAEPADLIEECACRVRAQSARLAGLEAAQERARVELARLRREIALEEGVAQRRSG